MDFSRIKWLFFDLGGTLIDETDPEDDRAKQIQSFARGRGIEIPIDEIKRLVGQAAAALERDIIAGGIARIIGDPTEAAAHSKDIGYSHVHEKPYPCAAGVLSRIKAKYKLGVIANQKLGAEDRLKRYGLMEHISIVASSAEAGLHKPDPALFRLALDKAGCRAREAVMVGDRLDNDIRPAKALGMGTVWVRQGYHGLAEPREKAEKPDYIIHNLIDLQDLVIDPHPMI